MRILDLFAGTGSATQAFTDAGHQVVTVEWDNRFSPDITMDVLNIEAVGYYDFIWASPPCTTFSVASIGTHWGGGKRAYQPRTPAALHAIDLVEHTRILIERAQPRWWIVENPRGVLRKLNILPPPTTVWYCQYGDERAKPTDLFGDLPKRFRPLSCRNGADDHVSAPRGAKTGTQGRKGSVERSMVPLGLSQALLESMDD